MCIGIGMGGTVIWENPHWTGAAAERSSQVNDVSCFDRAQEISSDAERVTAGPPAQGDPAAAEPACSA